jgi:plastocyanin
MKSHQSSLLFVVLLAACGGSTTNPGTDAGHDAASTPVDSGGTTEDSGGSTVDSGGTVDSGTPAVDSGSTTDAGPAPDGCAVTFSGCTTIDDHTGETAVTIAFAGFSYAPHCIRVDVGTVVTIPGSLTHPLFGATCSPDATPLSTVEPSTTGGDFTFTAAGAYGYYCGVHGSDLGTGMSGLIIVE